MADKKKMPVDGAGSEMHETDENGELASRRDAHSGGLPNVGESGGGAYPNPHDGKKSGDSGGGFLDHGGQSQQGYYGKGRLGDKKVDDDGDQNAVSTED